VPNCLNTSRDSLPDRAESEVLRDNGRQSGALVCSTGSESLASAPHGQEKLDHYWAETGAPITRAESAGSALAAQPYFSASARVISFTLSK